MLDRIVAGQPLGKGMRGARWLWTVMNVVPGFGNRQNDRNDTIHYAILALSLL